jgi:hypothetical protein
MEIKRYLNKKVAILLSIVILIIPAGIFTYSFLVSGIEPILRFVSGTEYISGETGQVIVRLSDTNGNPINNAMCNVSILYPDKSYFLVDFPLVPSSEPGNYYAQFTTPTLTGIYEETAKCAVISNNKENSLTISSSFHVSVALNFIVEMSALQADRYRDIVARLNQTINEVNTSRSEVLTSINKTFNEQFTVELGKAQTNITSSINNSFTDLYSDMTQLGTSIQNIFNK